MFSLLGRSTRLCDGIARRELLRVGGLGAMGLSLPQLLSLKAAADPSVSGDPTFGRAKSVIYVWLQGGPPQHETFDPKPSAASGIRGEFSPIATNVPGIDFCELLPRTARIADKLAVVRSIATDNNQHSGSGYEVLTGNKYRGSNPRIISATDWPWFGSLVKLLKPSKVLPPLSAVWIPQMMRLNENVTPAGQTAGFLGRQWNPDRFEVDPADPNDRVRGLGLADVPIARLERRLSLLDQVERGFGLRGREPRLYDNYQDQAFDILLSGKVQRAFDVGREPEAVRRRYGAGTWNQCLLLARRLVEAGVRLVHVNWAREPGDSAVDNPMWDTHAQNADRLEDALCPLFDIGFTALVEDLDQRGLLDETLVVAIGEFGRTPKINDKGGRDHWGSVFSFALAGAGIAAGQVFGASDRDGAYPARDRVTPADLCATLFHLLGIDPAASFHDAERREHRLTTGEPIWPLLGTAPATVDRVVPGGSIDRVPPRDGRLLAVTGFAAGTPVRPAGFGSRPKGWRAAPLKDAELAKGFGVVVEAGGPVARLGWLGGADSPQPAAGQTAVLAQEMRNPRAGRYRLRVRVRAGGPDKQIVERLFEGQLACRIELFRFTELSKDPTKRQVLLKKTFVPHWSAGGAWQVVELAGPLDSTTPGSNFAIGKGLGVAIRVERTGGGTLPAEPVFLEVERVELEFGGRTVNEKVTV